MPDINEYYEHYWESPDDYYDPTTPQRQALLKKHLTGLPEGAKMLDLGCGRGEFCAFFKEQFGCEPHGIDLSGAAIEFARQQAPGLRFTAGPTDQLLPEEAGHYDLVFSSEVIEHLFDVGEYLHQINQLLRDGGTVVLTTPYHGLIKNALICLRNFDHHFDPLGQHIRFFDRKGLDRCLRRWGFEATVWTGYGRPWPLYKSFFVVAKKVRNSEGGLSVGTGGAVND